MQLPIANAVIAYDYKKQASAQAPLLFLHGALGVRGQFDALRECFADRSQIAMDFPSHGESTVKRADLNCEQLAHDALALLDALGIEQVDIIGHSMGGYVGLLMAHQAPGRVGSVVNLGTKFYWSEQAIEATLKDLDADLLRSRSQRQYDGLAAMHLATGVDHTLRLTQSLIADFRRWQLTEHMVRASNVPLLLAAGDRDKLVPPSEVIKLFDALDARQNAVAILPNTPHPLPHLPTGCFEVLVRRFWDSCAPSTARQAWARPQST